MADELLTYYERELAFLRQIGREFASKYPKIAGRLLLEGGQSEDPHVERIVQAFAFLAARVHHKIDDEFPEITDALLGMLYPHYLAPIPSMAIVQFVVDPEQGKLTSGHAIARETMLYSQPVAGTACRFRTCYPVTLWPIEVISARLEEPDRRSTPPQALAVLKLGLRCLGGTTFADLDLERLRFFLSGEGQLTYRLYELLFNHVCQVQFRPVEERGTQQPLVRSPQCLKEVGFGRDEGMLPYTARSFLGYRMLQEYFSFPEKHLFVDVCELDVATRAGFGERMEVCFFLDQQPRLEHPLSPATFLLGCTPIINLFEHIAEPMRINHAQMEYRVVPDARRQNMHEVYAINRVTCTAPHLDTPLEIQPFYSLRHTAEAESQPPAFWYATRRPSPRQGDDGTEVYLTLVDPNFAPTLPAAETLTLRITCTNRDVPGKLPFGGDRGDFELEGAAPLTRIRCLTKPGDPVRSPLGRSAQWRFISHLSLNYLSICEGGREALQEMLRLYDFSDSVVVRQKIAGITNVTSRRVVGRPGTMPWNGFCRGMEVAIEFDEEKYIGTGLFLFASVLEKFFGLYASLNSFTQLVVTTQQRELPVKRWPPRAGEQILV